MEKINFVNNSQPALNATNLNRLQQNIENDIGDLTQLITTNKLDLVSATNELATNFNNFFESGTWTPQLACVGDEAAPTYTTSVVRGKYRKIGDLIYIEFYIRGKITALNGTNNYIRIKNMPFETGDLYQGQQALAIGVVYDLIQQDDTNYVINTYDHDIRVQVYNGANAAKYKVTTANYFEIGGSGFYIANVNQ